MHADRQGSAREETSGNPLSTLRFLGKKKRFVHTILICRSFPCSALQQGFVQAKLDNESLYRSHLLTHTHASDVCEADAG